jgi:hypothetical protein
MALKAQGSCVFAVPSYVWTQHFRSRHLCERDGYARFVIKSGKSIYPRSSIFCANKQRALIDRAGLLAERLDHVPGAPVVSGQIKQIL